MEHLSYETIELFAKGKFPYQRLLEISAHLVLCPDVCQPILDQIDPDLMADADRFEEERNEVIKGEHFTEQMIDNYVRRNFDLDERIKMNRHFTKCPVCAEKLKEKDSDYLSNFIKDTLEFNNHRETVVESKPFSFDFKFLIPVTAFSVLIIMFLVTILLLPDNNNADQAKINETLPSQITPLSSETNLANKNPSNSGSGEQKTLANENIQHQPSKQPGTKKSEPIGKIVNRNPLPKQSKKDSLTIAENRSLSKNCDFNPSLALTPNNEVITELQPELVWKPIPKATNYKLYLSDSEDILVEEATLPNIKKTAYKVMNKLELNKKYEWKVAATLENGKEFFSEPAYFTVGDKAKKFPQPQEKSKINEVRCLKSPN